MFDSAKCKSYIYEVTRQNTNIAMDQLTYEPISLAQILPNNKYEVAKLKTVTVLASQN